MNQSYSSNQKSQNAKFVIVTALVTLVVLGIAVWGIVFVANYQNKGKGEVSYTDNILPGATTPASTSDQTDSSASENTEPEPAEGVSSTTEGDSNSSESGNTDKNGSSSPCSSDCNKKSDNNVSSSNSGKGGSGAPASSVPNTGPEDFLPITLLLGTFVTFLTSQKLVNRDII
ncbi:MAG: hypothetical protein Q4F60_02365 [Candidatus Saccharibacteria bacterium]|nr:hypothetical protein [Candidatus Saccharibacteria bacterium]